MTVQEVKESIEYLKMQLTEDLEMICFTGYELKALDMSIQALEELEQYRSLGTVEELKEAREKQPKTDWIPCEVEMPKENFCSVWVSFTSPYTSYVRKAYWENGQFVWDNRKPIKDKPVAWMKYYPPQPYKKEGEENGEP